ncbi:two-component system, LytT family, response regulator LytT [Terribacillus halophilus]|uniref:Two-component system, LytT family, response regulator LytT n=1 Tax=Terribacillus halophilus TaxID=361279 RepID=A0A1G6LAT5_9BACI|nr:LytTR family transcriptional regulator DNA-binding domain-containing protein [Terribacillus halophilus]SDC40253.1 two-component system, LytT family, response regulator LytT [Terribacillus halophilus]
MMTAFIVEDEPLARQELAFLLENSREVEVVGEGSTLTKSYEAIRNAAPDVVFLDIELAEGTGLHLAEKLQELPKAPSFVFATAYDEYALQAFELHATDYLLKPFDEQRINQCIEKLQRMIPSAMGSKSQIKKLPIMENERISLLDIRTILYITTQGGKTQIKTLQKLFHLNEPLASVEKKLTNSSSFMRIHRSYIVHLEHVTALEPWFNSTYNLVMEDGSKVPVSRTYVKEVKERFGL